MKQIINLTNQYVINLQEYYLSISISISPSLSLSLVIKKVSLTGNTSPELEVNSTYTCTEHLSTGGQSNGNTVAYR